MLRCHPEILLIKQPIIKAETSSWYRGYVESCSIAVYFQPFPTDSDALELFSAELSELVSGLVNRHKPIGCLALGMP
jgi:hypothetical protein